MASSPVSDLSELDSDAFPPSERGGTTEPEDYDSHLKQPPSKRRRVAVPHAYPHHEDAQSTPTAANAAADFSDVSSDSSGSCPSSPRQAKDLGLVLTHELNFAADLIHACQWRDCEAGDLGDQDSLVKHMIELHVPHSKDEKYACDWGDCRQKTRAQLSAYALRAHLRSHTKEKPFFCSLPECDRSFTRSDALTKHMKTVHESEGPRTVEHYARAPRVTSTTAANTPNPDPAATASNTETISQPSQPPASKGTPKLKLVFNSSKSSSSAQTNGGDLFGSAEPTPPLSPRTREELFGSLPADLEFDEHETTLNRWDLFRLLRRQIHWAEEEGQELQARVEGLEEERRKEWLAKELVIENVLEAEFSTMELRGLLDQDGEDLTFGQWPDMAWIEKMNLDDSGTAMREKEELRHELEADRSLGAKLPIQGTSAPWYRDPSSEAMKTIAAKLASREDHVQVNDSHELKQQAASVVDGDETEDDQM